MIDETPPAWLDELPSITDGPALRLLGPGEGVDTARQPWPSTLSAMQWSTPTEKRPSAPLRNDYNLGTILQTDPRWAGRLRYNEFREEDEVHDCGAWRPLVDVDDVSLCRWVSDVYHLDYRTGSAREQVMLACNAHRAHPVREYLDGLEWDGVPRLADWLTDCLGVERSAASQAVGRAWLVSMVARVRRPGCKVDTVPVLIGKQGARKSSSLAALMPDPSWFAASFIDLRSKDMYQILRGKWLIELAEFEQFSGKHDAAAIKSYVTGAIDTYRASYGKRTRDVPRQTVMCGSTNAREFLVDASGARRWWLIETGECRPDRVEAQRDQLWAEADALHRAGTPWWLGEADATAAAELVEASDRYFVDDAWDVPIRAWLAQANRETTVAEVLEQALRIVPKDQGRGEQMRVAAVLQRLGWLKHKPHRGSVVWRRP